MVKQKFRLTFRLNHKNLLTKKSFAKNSMDNLKKYEFRRINDIRSGFITYRNHSLAKERPIAKECDRGQTRCGNKSWIILGSSSSSHCISEITKVEGNALAKTCDTCRCKMGNELWNIFCRVRVHCASHIEVWRRVHSHWKVCDPWICDMLWNT